MSSSSVNTYPIPRKDPKIKAQGPIQQDPIFMKTIKQNFILCIENVPSKQIKKVDTLLRPLYSLLGLTSEEERNLEEKRKNAKVDPPVQPAKTGFFKFLG